MKIMPDPFEEDDEEIGQPQESNKWLKYLLIALVIIISIPIVLLIAVKLMLSWGDGKEEEFDSSFTTELGDTFDNYYVTEISFLQGDNFCELRQKGKSDYLIRSKESYSNDDVEVIADEEQFRAYLVRGNIVYSSNGKDFTKMHQLSEADGKLITYAGQHLLSSEEFMCNYYSDYLKSHPDEKQTIEDGLRMFKSNGSSASLKKYGFPDDPKMQKEIMDNMWRYVDSDNDSLLKK